MFNITLKENYNIVKDFINPFYNPQFTGSEEEFITSSLLSINRQEITFALKQNICSIDVWDKYIPTQTAPHLSPKSINPTTKIRKMLKKLLLERYSYLVPGNSSKRKASSSTISSLVRNIFKVVMIKETGSLYIYNFRCGVWEPGELPIKRLTYELISRSLQLEWSESLENKIFAEIGRKIQPVAWKDFNQKGFPFMNYTLDYETLTMRKHDPIYFSTIKSDISYNPNATCPIFMSMLDVWFKGETATQHFVQEWFGYVLSGTFKANKFLLVYSKGGEGKSTLFGVLEKLVGKLNTTSAPLSNLNATFGLEPLVGKKLNLATENNPHAFDTSKLKAITAGEKITVNRKNIAETEMILPIKLVYLLNELPVLNDGTHGLQRRLLILPFLNTIPTDKQDKNLSKKLDNEMSGILNWALAGLNRLEANNYNFTISPSMQKIMRGYLTQDDVMRKFIKAKIQVCPMTKTKANEVIDCFVTWATNNGYTIANTSSPKIFWNIFQSQTLALGIFYTKYKSGGYQVIQGIKISQ